MEQLTRRQGSGDHYEIDSNRASVVDLVIIGNGVAGMNAAISIRSRDKTSPITIISSESDHFFSRTALMYVASGQMSGSDVEPYDRQHYERMNFTRIRDRVERLIPNQKSLRLSSGQTLSYDSLLIASGSVANMFDWPGRDLDGVGHFVTWQNLEWMQKAMKTTRKAVVVGGGLIGIEIVEVLLQAGIDVTFLIREAYFWPIALSELEGNMVSQHMEHHGCDVRLGTELIEIVGESGRVHSVETTEGEHIDCQIVMFAVGVKPQTDWLKNSDIELDKSGGIVVNERLETNLPGVWAAGDCTSVVWFNGVRRPEQLWYTSRDQGKRAGRNMAGDEGIYKRGTFYNSAKFFDLEYTTAGYVNFQLEGERDWYRREPNSERSVRITHLPDGSVIGFNMIGRRWDHRMLIDWVDQKRELTWVVKNLSRALFDEEFTTAFKLAESG